MRTYTPKKSDLQHDWYVVDATDVVLGRLASKIAHVIRGKHKPTYAPHMDGGDFVVVTNAEKVKVTGDKVNQKSYFRHTGYIGHAKFTSMATLLEKHPERVIEKAVFGMLPKGNLGKQVLRKKLKVYAGSEHPHAAQAPKTLDLKEA